MSNILSLVDTIEDSSNGKLYMITKLMTGGNLLSSVIQQNNTYIAGQANEANVRWMALQLLQGVQHLHESACITHNALHPANILINSTDGTIAIADFGAARPIEYSNSTNEEQESTGIAGCDMSSSEWNSGFHSIISSSSSGSSSTTLGTHRRRTATKKCSRGRSMSNPNNGYCAPELLHHSATQISSKAADMWSVGVILYFCLFGHDNEEQEEPTCSSSKPSQQSLLVERIQLQQFTNERHRLIWQSTSRHAKQFLANLLHLDPSVRMTVTEALQHPWLADLLLAQQQEQPYQGWGPAHSRTIPKKRGHRRGRRMLQRSLSKLAAYF